MSDSQQPPDFAKVAFLDGKVRHHTSIMTEQLEPCFQLLLYLEGGQRFYIDDRLFDIHAGEGSRTQPQIALIQRNKPCILRSLPNRGETVLRKVKISMPTTWSATLGAKGKSGIFKQFETGEITSRVWSANLDMVHLGEAIINPPQHYCEAASDEILQLYRLAKAMELLSLACMDLTGQQTREHIRQVTQTASHAAKVRNYVMDNLHEDLTIETLSRETGTSKRSLQRNFKHQYGMTVSDFIRKQRLEKARQAIENDGLTIGQAAFMAGYNNQSSFTNAFKQTYGSPPKIWRNKIDTRKPHG